MDYSSVLTWYQQRLREHGDSNLGIGWPDQQKAEVLYRVMLEVVPPGESASLLDFGCGPARMLDWMRKNPSTQRLRYSGIDFNSDSIMLARQKYPDVPFVCADILREPFEHHYDYVILNGILTMKAEMSFEAMWEYAQTLLTRVFALADRGIAFNVMSKAVDWEKDILFHLPTDLLIGFLTKRLSRRFVIRQDYAPFEYTVYVLR